MFIILIVYIRYLLLIILFFSCAQKKNIPNPNNKILKTPVAVPPLKHDAPGLVSETIFTMGLMTDYEVWEFLRSEPNENEVLETMGLPDSVWLSDNDSTKYLYYFIDKIQDFNLIEINSNSNNVSGFEWD